MCLLSTDFFSHFFLAIAGWRAPLGRFLEGVLYKYAQSSKWRILRNRTLVKNVGAFRGQYNMTMAVVYLEETLCDTDAFNEPKQHSCPFWFSPKYADMTE